MPTEVFAGKRLSFAPKKLDLYILTEVAGPFVGGMLFFSFVFLMFQLLRLAEFFIVHGVSLPTLAKMAGLLILSFLPMALPVAFLVAVLMSFGRLSSDSELVAMKASGISLFRMALPVCFFATFAIALSLALNLQWVPNGERAFKDLLIRISNTKAVSSVKEGTFTSGFFDLLIFAEKVDSKSNQMQKVFIYDEREPKNPLTVVAQTGEVVPVKNGSDIAASAVLKLYNGSIHRNDSSAQTYSKGDFGEYRLFLNVPEGAANSTQKPKMLAYNELNETIRKLPEGSQENRQMRAELWRRYAIAFSPMFFVFLGIGFGTVRTRAVRSGAALIAIVTLLIYWSLQTWGSLAAQRGLLPPVLAMQLPNFVILAPAIISFHRANW